MDKEINFKGKNIKAKGILRQKDTKKLEEMYNTIMEILKESDKK